jgi:hypothetical protein
MWGFGKSKASKVQRQVARALPRWCTLVGEDPHLEYQVDTTTAFKLFLESMGKTEDDMDVETYHTCRKGVTRYIADIAPVPGMVRLMFSRDEWVPFAKSEEFSASAYRRYMDAFRKIAKR